MKRWKLLILSAAMLPLAAKAAEPETNIVIEARVIKVWDRDFKALKLGDALKERGTQALDPKAQAELLAKLEANKNVHILNSPRVTAGNEQTVGVNLRHEQSFTTALTVELDQHGTVRCVPKQLVMPLGCSFQFTPSLSADRQYVRLKYEMSETTVHPNTPVHPVTTYVTPKYEGGSEGPPIPTTQFIMQPAFDTETMQANCTYRDGYSILMEFSNRKCSVSSDVGLPILSNFAPLGDLFTWNMTLEDNEHTLVLLTAKASPVVAALPDAAPVPSPLTVSAGQLRIKVPTITESSSAGCLPPNVYAFSVDSFLPPVSVAGHQQLVPSAPSCAFGAGCCDQAVPMGQAPFPATATPIPAPPVSGFLSIEYPVGGTSTMSCASLPVNSIMRVAPGVYCTLAKVLENEAMQGNANNWPDRFNYVAKVEKLEPIAAPSTKNVEILKILLEQYEVACKAGDSAKARTIAAYCLEMDPTCFAKLPTRQ